MAKARSLSLPLSCLYTMLLLSTGLANAEDNNSLFNQLPGDHELGMRTRFQKVNDNNLGDAQAMTTRLKLTSVFTLDDNKQWQFIVEPNYVHAFNDGRYNSVSVKKNTSPIPDPQSFNWNKVNVNYRSDNDWLCTCSIWAFCTLKLPCRSTSRR